INSLFFLQDQLGVPSKHIHVVGHSLGAQLAGYTGEYLKSHGAILGRITGLDPAEPYFEGTDPVVRLDPTDAELVDVIHTDAGPIITGDKYQRRKDVTATPPALDEALHMFSVSASRASSELTNEETVRRPWDSSAHIGNLSTDLGNPSTHLWIILQTLRSFNRLKDSFNIPWESFNMPWESFYRPWDPFYRPWDSSADLGNLSTDLGNPSTYLGNPSTYLGNPSTYLGNPFADLGILSQIWDPSLLMSPPTGLGILQPSGHFDFYPNGGVRMPGCGAHFVDAVAKEQGNIPYGLRRFIGCNHIRSYEYFTESINSECPFLSIECGSWEAYWKGLCWECGDDWSRCARMGAHTDSYLNYSLPDVPLKKMYLITGPDSPFCTLHHRVRVIMSYTAAARRHGGDIGVFHITLFGQHGASPRLKLNPEEMFFEPGNVYSYMIGTADLGHLHYVVLEWSYVTAYYNPLSWRLLSNPVVYVNRIHIDSIEMQERYEFCGLDMPFHSGTQRQLEWQAGCPEQAPPPGASFLGTIINFDVEDTISNNIDAVNSGLNSLGNGQFINNLASSANQATRELMEDARRRMGTRFSKTSSISEERNQGTWKGDREGSFS
ncbi:uncharacterized protein LOC121863643, partial [Homarus americanus]|uniref:uncharacterized protein LOC121863643 n=1 Tax=Homarus americanus TaxID=6706 RepID=UPI001C46E251